MRIALHFSTEEAEDQKYCAISEILDVKWYFGSNIIQFRYLISENRKESTLYLIEFYIRSNLWRE